MKNIKNFNEFINEELPTKLECEALKHLPPPSDNETDEEFDKIKPQEVLKLSVDNNYIGGVEKALERGANINFKYKLYLNREFLNLPIIYEAIQKGNLEMVKILIENGADLNITYSIIIDTLLIINNSKNRFKMIKLLVENGADVNAVNKEGYTPLMVAYLFNNKEIIDYLIKKGANDDSSNNFIELDQILDGYLQAAIWTEEERLKEETEMGVDIGECEFDKKSIEKAKEDIIKFITFAGLEAVEEAIDENDNNQLGTDIWLTRNEHGANFMDRNGANFMDRNYSDKTEKKLMNAAHKLGEGNLFIRGKKFNFD